MNNDQIASKQDFQFGVRNIDDIRESCTELTKELHNKMTDEQILHLAQIREVPKEVFNNTDLFYFSEDEKPNIDDNATGLLPMRGRVLFPVKTVYNKVMGFVGYDKFVEPKYLDSHTYGYNAKHSTCYGMENLKEYLESSEPVFLTEGLIDSLVLRYLGYNSLALLGSYLNNTIVNIFENKFCFYVADNDESGNDIVKRQIKPKLKKCFCFCYIPNKYISKLDKKEHTVKDTNDAYVCYGEDKLKQTIDEIKQKLILSNNVIRSL